MKLDIQTFTNLSKDCAVYDVRTPAEYEHAHIPGAKNLPIFSNDERALIGTLYKKSSREKAILKGFELFGPKMKSIIERLISYGHKPGDTVLFHCWRGGMRSEAMAWIAQFYGFESHILEGGYKAFRNNLLQRFNTTLSPIIIGGFTGSGKTQILHALQNMGEYIIDIEAIAHHRGSSFGAIGNMPQGSQEDFENKLALAYPEMQIKRLFIEDESRKIGRNILPIQLYETIQSSPVVFIDIPQEKRLMWLAEQYQDKDRESIREAIVRLSKRLGGANTKAALEELDNGNLNKCFAYPLAYYDDTYNYGISRRNPDLVYRIPLPDIQHESNAEIILDFIQKNFT